MIEAEIQKKLTKASGYLSGQLVKALGLRYAPELRFFKDNTLEVLKGFKEQKDRIDEEAKEEHREETGEDNIKPIVGLLKYIEVFKKLSEGEKIAFLTHIPEDMQDQVQTIL